MARNSGSSSVDIVVCGSDGMGVVYFTFLCSLRMMHSAMGGFNFNV